MKWSISIIAKVATSQLRPVLRRVHWQESRDDRRAKGANRMQCEPRNWGLLRNLFGTFLPYHRAVSLAIMPILLFSNRSFPTSLPYFPTTIFQLRSLISTIGKQAIAVQKRHFCSPAPQIKGGGGACSLLFPFPASLHIQALIEGVYECIGLTVPNVPSSLYQCSFVSQVDSGVISKNFNKGGFRSNVIKWTWPSCNDAHIFKDGDIII